MARSAKGADAKSRLQVAAVFLVVLAAGALLGSLVVGLFGWGAPDAPPALRPDAGGLPAGTRVRVEVLNASGTTGLAAEGRRILRAQGFDVVYVGNAEGWSPDTSVVVDRVGRLAWARAVADSLGIRRVETRQDANKLSDVVVVLGRDWQVPMRAGAPPPPE